MRSVRQVLERAWHWFVVPLCLVALAVACSPGTGNDQEEAPHGGKWDALNEVPSVRIVVPTEAGLVEQWIPAVGGAVAAATNDQGVRSAALRPKDQVIVGEETVEVEPGFTLLAGAAAECGVYAGSQEKHGVAQ